MKIDLQQAGVVALLTAAAIGLWWAGAKLGFPPQYSTPAAMALLGAVVGTLKSYVQPPEALPATKEEK